MNTRYELDQLRERVNRMDQEVDETRRLIVAMEARLTEEVRRVETAGDQDPLEQTIPEATPEITCEPMAVQIASAALAGTLQMPPPLPPMPVVAVAAPCSPSATFGAKQREPAAPEEPSQVRVWLQHLQLWPPAGENNTEVRLGAWWATRIGALLAVIGVVFFGVYISLDTPPWVKLAELAVIALGVSALGLWLERKVEAFGAVVFAGGLSLGYFTAFAAYVLPAVKVIDRVWVATVWQIIAVTVLVAASLWRRSSMIATLALALGFVTAVFSRNGGLSEFAVLTAGLLGLVAVALRRTKKWEGPSVVAMPSAYMTFGLVWQGALQRDAVPASAWAWVFLAVLLVVFFFRDWRRVKVIAAEVPSAERWFQGVNSSLAVLSGVVVTLLCYRAELAEFYFGTALVLTALAWLRSRQVERDAVSAMLLAKATGALTLWVIEIAEARTIAIALMVQAWVMAWTARRVESRVLTVGTFVVVTLAAGFHFCEGIAPTAILSLGALQSMAFVLGLAALAHEAGRWLLRDATARRQIGWLGAVVAGAAAVAAVIQWTPAGWSPALLVGMTALFGLMGWLRRGAAPGWAAASTLLAANAILWGHAVAATYDARLALNATFVLGATGGVSWVLGGRELWRRSGWFAGAVTVIGAVLTAFNLYGPAIAFGLTAGGALLLTVFAPKAPGRVWSGLATLAAGLGLCCWVESGLAASPRLWLAGAAAALWALPMVRRVNHNTDSPVTTRVLDALQLSFSTVVTLRLLWVQFHGAALGTALAAVAAAVFTLGLWPGIRSAVPVSRIFSVGAVFAVANLRVYPLSHRSWIWLGMAVVLCWWPAWAWTRFGQTGANEGGWWRRNVAGVETVLATLLSALAVCHGFTGMPELLACVTVTFIALGVLRLGRVRAARRGTVALAVLLGFTTLSFINRGVETSRGSELAAVALVALLIGLLPRWMAGGPAAWETPMRRRADWLGGGAGLGLWFVECLAKKGELAPYVTVGWGIAAALWFMGGLVLRTTPYRLLGLIGLGLCIPRVFFVDLQSTLYRIVAFMVIGVVLLWVGFSYHRFRHLIIESGDEAEQKR